MTASHPLVKFENRKAERQDDFGQNNSTAVNNDFDFHHFTALF
jgi:hypothetical protein